MSSLFYILLTLCLVVITGAAYYLSFKKISTKRIQKTVGEKRNLSEYMNTNVIESSFSESDFWKLIEYTNKESKGDKERQVKLITDILDSKSDEEVLSYGKIYECLYSKSATEKLWAMIYGMNGGCGDDSFDYYRAWLISEGETKFYDLLGDPETLPEKYSTRQEIIGFLEEFSYIYSDVTESRNNEDFFSRVYKEYGNSCSLVEPEEVFEWEEDMVAVKERFPKFYKQFVE